MSVWPNPNPISLYILNPYKIYSYPLSPPQYL